jgi:hypothetical protein
MITKDAINMKNNKEKTPSAKTKLEMSKGIVVIVIVAYILSMAAAYTLPIIFEWVGTTSLKIFQTTATLTGSILLGYYGKAGFENYDKNKKLLKFEDTDDNENEEGGNG